MIRSFKTCNCAFSSSALKSFSRLYWKNKTQTTNNIEYPTNQRNNRLEYVILPHEAITVS